jgi:hypothetical protein
MFLEGVNIFIVTVFGFALNFDADPWPTIALKSYLH